MSASCHRYSMCVSPASPTTHRPRQPLIWTDGPLLGRRAERKSEMGPIKRWATRVPRGVCYRWSKHVPLRIPTALQFVTAAHSLNLATTRRRDCAPLNVSRGETTILWSSAGVWPQAARGALWVGVHLRFSLHCDGLVLLRRRNSEKIHCFTELSPGKFFFPLSKALFPPRCFRSWIRF